MTIKNFLNKFNITLKSFLMILFILPIFNGIIFAGIEFIYNYFIKKIPYNKKTYKQYIHDFIFSYITDIISFIIFNFFTYLFYLLFNKN